MGGEEPTREGSSYKGKTYPTQRRRTSEASGVFNEPITRREGEAVETATGEPQRTDRRTEGKSEGTSKETTGEICYELGEHLRKVSEDRYILFLSTYKTIKSAH